MARGVVIDDDDVLNVVGVTGIVEVDVEEDDEVVLKADSEGSEGCDEECEGCEECEDEEDYDEDFDDENTITLRCKWTMDGAKTLDEAIDKMYGFIEYLKKLKEDGYEFTQTMDDDWGFLRKKIEQA